MEWSEFSYWIGMAATVAFATTAVWALASRGVDLFGAVVLGVITAVGGGTVRDLILGVPVFWAADLEYVWVGMGASVLAFLSKALFHRQALERQMLYLDGFGAAMFGVQATGKVWDLGFGLPLAPIMLGVLTAIGGGLIRDVLAGRPTLLMSREIYAIPVLLGSILFVVALETWPEYRFAASIVCMVLCFGIRAGAIRWGWRVPSWMTTRAEAR